MRGWRRTPSLAAAVVDRAGKEPDGGVQFQLLETLGFLHGADAEAAQSSLLFAHIDDQWMQRAALTAGPERAAQYLARALAPGLDCHADATRRAAATSSSQRAS